MKFIILLLLLLTLSCRQVYYSVGSDKSTEDTSNNGNNIDNEPELILMDVNFTRTDGIYTSSAFESDFGTLEGYSSTEQNRTWIEDGCLKTTLIENSAASASGLVANNILDNTYESLTMEYNVKFQDGFDWSRGGKLPGISGGDGNTGNDKADDGKGWSVRLMWREGGKLIPYVYHYNQPETYGDKFGVSNLTYFEDNRWYTIKIKVTVNTGSNSNGSLEIDVDGVKLFSKDDICYATEDGKREINKIRWAIFRGGSDSTWYSQYTQHIYFDDVKIYVE